jgi:hypothetical protein
MATYNTVVTIGHGPGRQVPVRRSFGYARCFRRIFTILLLLFQSFYPWRAYSVLSQGAKYAIRGARG